jgi:hypothetical protein
LGLGLEQVSYWVNLLGQLSIESLIFIYVL